MNEVIGKSVSKNSISLLCKLLLFVIIGYLLYRQIFISRDFDELWKIFNNTLRDSSILPLGLVLLIMPFNWLLEALKWKTLVNYFSSVTFKEALTMVLVGVSFGVVTPSRLGEYAGRFIMMHKGSRWETISATFVGSIAQNLVTGIIGLLSILGLMSIDSSLQKHLYISYAVLVAALLLIGLIIYYGVDTILHLIHKIPYGKIKETLFKHSLFLKEISLHDLHFILGVSGIRYGIYALQYALLLGFYGIEVPFFEGILVIGLIYLIQSGVPLPPLLGLIARGEIAVIVWSIYSDNTLGILATSFTLWVINLVLPAIGGLVLMITNGKDRTS